MPIDRTMTVSLSDPSGRTIVTFRRSGSQVFVDTFVDGGPQSTPVSAADLAQLSVFLGDLANTRWSDLQGGTDAAVPAPGAAAQPPAPRPGGLPPYPQTARWVPAPSGGLPGSDSPQQ